MEKGTDGGTFLIIELNTKMVKLLSKNIIMMMEK